MRATHTDIPLSAIKPFYKAPINPSTPNPESAIVKKTIQALHLQPHVEGGYFVETDRDSLHIPNPFLSSKNYDYQTTVAASEDNSTRSASTTIFYFLSPGSPLGSFHRNRGRTIHTLHSGRGRYVLIHVDKVDGKEKAHIETFVVGHDLAKGEKLQWIVEGGKYKATYLLPDNDETGESNGLLISEVSFCRFFFCIFG